MVTHGQHVRRCEFQSCINSMQIHANPIDLYHVYLIIITSSSRASRGRKFQKKKKWCIARKEFAYRMRARRPTSAMPKPFLCCERAFCCSMVLMCQGGDLTSFDVMRSVAG